MRIVNFGSCNVDYVHMLDHIVRLGETEQCSGRKVLPGGKGLNQSIAIARAGGEVYHAGCVGDNAEILRKTLDSSGVDISFLRRVEGTSGFAIVQLAADGNNAIFTHPGANRRFTREYIDEVLSRFSAGDLVILQNEINLNDYIIARAWEKGMRIFLSPSPMDESIFSLDFEKLDYLIINEGEGERLTGLRDPARILSSLRTGRQHLNVLLTLGEKGSMLAAGDRIWTMPAFDVKTVDTTAAGDTFTGYFIVALAEGWDLAEAMKWAAAAAALAVTEKGGAPSIPTRQEVEQALTWLTPKPVRVGRREDELRRKIDAYFSENLPNASLADLASSLGYSTAHTGHLLRKVTGQSFSEYVQALRCAKAAELLTTTDEQVSWITSLIGYNNKSFFRNKFRALYGCTPLAYRKLYKKPLDKDGGVRR